MLIFQTRLQDDLSKANTIISSTESQLKNKVFPHFYKRR